MENEGIIRSTYSLLNPRDRAYHFADYVEKRKTGCPTKDELHDLLAKLIDALIPNLRDAVREKEKETKTAYPKPKKKEIYEMVIQERLTNFDLAAPMNNVVDWFERLHSFIQNEIMENCKWLYDDQIYAVIDGIIDDNKNATTSHETIENPIEALIRSTYDKKAPILSCWMNWHIAFDLPLHFYHRFRPTSIKRLF
ncbi:hypothetical protein [Paenibacillus sp. sgz500958]|uniref:hypothetical protein n=1 Tax=Paenibacillus sp. sgz500958 TaxID=3242475 RepID=UPI0036D3F38F